MTKTPSARRIFLYGALVSLLAAAFAASPPASAAAGVTITDADGHGSYDPAAPSGETGDVATTNDGSSEATDILQTKLETTTSSGRKVLRATTVIDGRLPGCPPFGGSCLPGVGLPSDMDLPDDTFDGATFYVLFQNKDKQTNGDNPHTGCARFAGGRGADRHGHWADGFHNFLALRVHYDLVTQTWEYHPTAGEFDPGPGRGFRHTYMETEPNMSGRFAADVTYWGGDTTVIVEMTSVYLSSMLTCVSGVHQWDLAAELADARPGPYSSSSYVGDRLANVFGLTTADRGMTDGHSQTWSDCTNRSSPSWEEVCQYGKDRTTDTAGPGPTCPTNTAGGTAPENPLWAANQNQPCHIDDDVAGNTGFNEFKPSGYDFIADF